MILVRFELLHVLRVNLAVTIQLLLRFALLVFRDGGLVDLDHVLGAGGSYLFLVHSGLQLEHVSVFPQNFQLRFQGVNLLRDAFDLRGDLVLFVVLLTRVVENLPVDVGFLICDLLEVAVNLGLIFGQSDFLVVQALFLLRNRQLLSFVELNLFA